ncbi:expressed unknown protein [Seminavis robusta]|uniref:BTB domain-containing protein n=1 Tax=Seminavis robusta TaxID=568900 RepID=A0A9N8HTQ0_9STRA|nr:expressed unknown protein [Seminavis robusta]|eukprot:Sro1626_g286880.1 n/a (357) ;mRNA; r:12765-13835
MADSGNSSDDNSWNEFLGSFHNTNYDIEDLPQFQLASHVGHLRQQVDLSDGILVTNDGVEFPIHKLILASRSEYFKTLFYGSFQKESTLHLPFDSTIIEAILSYCYADSFSSFGGGSHEENTNNHNNQTAQDLGRQIVRLAAAASFLLLEGMIRKLWVRSLKIMFQQPDCIPIMYQEAEAQNVRAIQKLAIHAYWITTTSATQQQPQPGSLSSSHFTSPHGDLESTFHPDAAYDTHGVFLCLGCSEEQVNGDYYAEGGPLRYENDQGFRLEPETTPQHEGGALELGTTILLQDPHGHRRYKLWSMIFPPTDHLPHQWGICSSAASDGETTNRNNQGDDSIPPISFFFKRSRRRRQY